MVKCLACREELRSAREDIRKLTLALENERQSRAEYLKGDLRRLEAQVAELLRERDWYSNELRNTKNRYNDESSHGKFLGSQIEHLKCEVSESASRITTLTKDLFAATCARTARHRATAERKALQQAVVTAAGNAKAKAEARALAAAQRNARLRRLSHEEAAEKVCNIELELEAAREAAAEALEDYHAEQEAAEEARKETSDAKYAKVLVERQLKRALATSERLSRPKATGLSVDEWAKLQDEARWKKGQRDRASLAAHLKKVRPRVEDIAQVLGELELFEPLVDTKEGTLVYYKRTSALIAKLETEYWGIEFALFLHYEMRLSQKKALQMVQAASMRYNRMTDRYASQVLWYDKHRKANFINVPRLVPPRSKVEPIIRMVESELGVTSAEDGRLARRSFVQVVLQMIKQDPGTQGMPLLSSFHRGKLKFPLVIKLDATGYGKLQVNTIAVDTPFTSKSAQNLRLLGLGNCSDDRDGSMRLLGDANLRDVNELLEMAEQEELLTCQVADDQYDLALDPFFVFDLSALRHVEHLAKSGFCGCSMDDALRKEHTKPPSKEHLFEFLKRCESPTKVQRFVRSHMPLPGKTVPEPCDCCDFGNDPSKAVAQMNEMLATEAALSADKSKAGKDKFSKWRMAHASLHKNVQPGKYGKPTFHHDMDKQILDPLHQAELGVPKTPWKHGVKNNASDDAREKISQQLAEWKHALDMRRKDDNRCREQKWFTGEKWATFCAGERGSPGGPIAIATITLIIAEDMQAHGIDSSAAMEAGSGGRGNARGGGRGRGRGLLAPSSAAAPAPPSSGVRHVPTAVEKEADPEDLEMIRKLYGSRAQTLINILLSFDAYFNWYYPFKHLQKLPIMSEQSVRLEKAFDNCCTAIDMNEIFERVTIRKHKSYLMHAAIFKTTRDILRVGNVWAYDTSSLELQNADTKRVAASSAPRRLTTSGAGQLRVGLKSKVGPSNKIATKGFSSSMALGTLKHLLATQYLRRGDGIIATPESRRNERLFGVTGTGRTTDTSTGIKMEKLDSNYAPEHDTCIKAFVRLLAANAEQVPVGG